MKFILSFFIMFTTLFAQESPSEKLEFMKNLFITGAENEAYIVASELVSFSKYKEVREESLLALAEHFFVNGVLDSNLTKTNKAYTYYLYLNRDYPNSKYKDLIQQRLKFLERNYMENQLFRDLNDYYKNEQVIVSKKVDFLNALISYRKENPYLFFAEGDNQNIIDVVNRYLDDIIINHPQNAVWAYYVKLLSLMSKDRKIKIFESRFSEYKGYQSQSMFDMEKSEKLKLEIDDLLNQMILKFPKHPLTIKANLVVASYLINANLEDDDSLKIKQYLEYVLTNEEDKYSLTFILAKEYLLRTEFNK